jgi:hypothetical protein
MSDSKFIQNYVRFVREGVASSAREVKPSSWSAYDIGTVTNLTPRDLGTDTPVDKPIAGVWRTWDMKHEEDKLEISITVSEINAEFWKLVWQANPTLSGGAANYVPGSTLVTKGWMQVMQYNDAAALNNTVEIFCHVKIQTQDFGRGIIGATWNVTKLYSTLNSGSFANLTY